MGCSISKYDLFMIFTALPKFTKQPTNVTVQASSTVRLDCAVDGDPKPQIYWQFNFGNDFPAARERRMHVMPQDDAFFIVQTKASDQGVYTCTAENPAGIIRANATVQVCKYFASIWASNKSSARLRTNLNL